MEITLLIAIISLTISLYEMAKNRDFYGIKIRKKGGKKLINLEIY